jgi:probable F420-dependent oxidoreductase
MSQRALTFGTFITDQATVAQKAITAEELGFDLISCGEHVSFYGPVTNSYISLACAAGVTSSIQLMSGIALLPLYPAALAAKLGAALDVVSNGRYVFGIGVGGELPKEFEACGVPVSERGARADEALEIIKRLWTEPSVTFEGRFNTLDAISIDPCPVQRPHPPIWVAGRRGAAARRAARHGDGWLPYMYTPEQLHASISQVRDYAEQYDRDPESIECGVFLWTALHDDANHAIDSATQFLSQNYSQDFTQLVERYALAGDSSACIARLREYIEAGATRIIFAPAWNDSEAADVSTRCIADTLLPEFRRVE